MKRKFDESDKDGRNHASNTVRLAKGALLGLKTSDILQQINDNKLEKESKKLSTLTKPLEKPVAVRVKRNTEYLNVAGESNKWEGLVYQRRKAAQLQFPIDKPDLRVINSERQYKPKMKTPLEREVYKLLQGADLAPQKEETEEEMAIKKAMSLQEVRERSMEIYRARILRQRMEKKLSYKNKSKNRQYHRLLRKEKQKKEAASFNKLKNEDPEAALEVVEKMEKTRIAERMSLRHSKSKWIHLQQTRAGQDKNALSAVHDVSNLNQELRQKIKNIEDSNKDENEKNDEEDEFLKELQLLSELADRKDKTMSEEPTNLAEESTNKIEEPKDLKVITDIQEFSLVTKNTSKKKKKKVATKNNIDNASSFDDVDIAEMFDKAQAELEKVCPVTEAKETVKPDANNSVKKKKKKNSKLKTNKDGPEMEFDFLNTEKDENTLHREEMKLNPKDFLKIETKVLPSDVTEENFLEEAFEDDYNVEEFKKEKKKAEQESLEEQDDSGVLPGWGSWAGPDIKAVKRKRKLRFKLPKPKAKIHRPDNIIYKEKDDLKSIKNMMVTHIPYDYRSIKEYEDAIKNPTGRLFVPEISEDCLTKPNIITKLGAIIEPLQEDDVLKCKRRNNIKTIKEK